MMTLHSAISIYDMYVLIYTMAPWRKELPVQLKAYVFSFKIYLVFLNNFIQFFKICFFCFEQFDPISFSQAITRKWPLHKMGFSACPSVSFYIKMKRNRWKSITSQKTNLKSVQSKVFKNYPQQSSQSTGTR